MQTIDVLKFTATLVIVMAGVRLVQTKVQPESGSGKALAFLFR